LIVNHYATPFKVKKWQDMLGRSGIVAADAVSEWLSIKN